MVYKKECCGRCTCAALASPLDLDAWVTLRFLLVCFGLVFPFSFFFLHFSGFFSSVPFVLQFVFAS